MNADDWQVYAHPLFLDQLDRLIAAVGRARRKDPAGYASTRDAKMLAAIVKVAFDDIPAEPSHPRFEQGETLGPTRRHWRRAKFLQQYRLFFRYSTTAKVVVLAWVNDERTRRAYGSRTDPYATFARMLKQGDPPDAWDALSTAATSRSARERLAGIRRSD